MKRDFDFINKGIVLGSCYVICLRSYSYLVVLLGLEVICLGFFLGFFLLEFEIINKLFG